MVQIAAGLALTSGRKEITRSDVEWVVNSGQYAPRPEKGIPPAPQVGLVNGMAVYGPNMGTLIEVEAAAIPVDAGKGQIVVTGIMEEEEMGGYGRTMRRKSMAKSSMENVITVLRQNFHLRPQDYDIHVNFPGGTPVDGPSAGIAVVTAIYSAITGRRVNNVVAMTGEVSIRGLVKPVGGVVPKLEAARLAGVKRAIIPKENWQASFASMGEMAVHGVERLEEVITLALLDDEKCAQISKGTVSSGLLSASG